MTRHKSIFSAAQVAYQGGPEELLTSQQNSIDRIKKEINDLEEQVELLMQEIHKIEISKIKMNYFTKRDMIDQNGNITVHVNHINSPSDENETSLLDSTLSEYERHREFKTVMQLVAHDEKFPVWNKEPDKWSLEMRNKIRIILDKDYENYQLLRDKHVKKCEEGFKKLDAMKCDLKKITSKLKLLQTALKQVDLPSKTPRL